VAADEREGLTYRKSGVDIDAGGEVVERIREHVLGTHGPEVLAGSHGGFGGLFHLGGGFRDPVLVGATDGVGTKLKVAFAAGIHDTVGIDLVAMCVNDVLVCGARPIFFLDYVATGAVEPAAVEEIIRGIAAGCRDAGCALLGGETAEMPGFYRPKEYDLAGFAVGVVERDRILDGGRMRPGDTVLGLPASGLHSNGFSLVRRALLECADPLPLGVAPRGFRRTLAEELLVPTRIYVRPVLSVLAALPGAIHALAHITGGGLVENIPRVVPAGLGIRLDRSAWPRPPIFALVEERGRVARSEMDRVFNQGIGLVVIAAKERAREVCDAFAELREPIHAIGEVVAGNGVEIAG
jgi:phosphoribosylformylglycinamidine cyclo-ligase